VQMKNMPVTTYSVTDYYLSSVSCERKRRGVQPDPDGPPASPQPMNVAAITGLFGVKVVTMMPGLPLAPPPVLFSPPPPPP
jgi:hypothetical protein